MTAGLRYASPMCTLDQLTRAWLRHLAVNYIRIPLRLVKRADKIRVGLSQCLLRVCPL